LAIGILCGSGASIEQRDHRETDKGLRNASSKDTDCGAVPAKRASKPDGSSVAATGGMKRAQHACQSGVVGNN
jgi:hypothetical protein